MARVVTEEERAYLRADWKPGDLVQRTLPGNSRELRAEQYLAGQYFGATEVVAIKTLSQWTSTLIISASHGRRMCVMISRHSGQ